MSHLVTVTKHFWPLQVVTNHFLAVTLRDITLYVVNNHRIARTIKFELYKMKKSDYN
jgi:hypothetical protein